MTTAESAAGSELTSMRVPGADLEHNLGGGQEHARGTGRASGERCGKVSPSPCEAEALTFFEFKKLI